MDYFLCVLCKKLITVLILYEIVTIFPYNSLIKEESCKTTDMHRNIKFAFNKIKGTPILKLAIVKRLEVKKFIKIFVKKFRQKIR